MLGREHVIALVGNPNTGKSTVFNRLTGLHQHTGNWPGKTVTLARGRFRWNGRSFSVVDLPGTYSLFAHSMDEEITRDFICLESPDLVIAVTDATCLERNLNLVLQVLEMTPNVVVCLNLMDEARKRQLLVDVNTLQTELGVPVVPCSARLGEGMRDLKNAISAVATKTVPLNPARITYSEAVEEKVDKILPHLNQMDTVYNPRWLALRLLEKDNSLIDRLIEASFNLDNSKTAAP